MDQNKINRALEAICNTGCQSVNAIILTLEAGHRVEGVEDFDKEEITLLTRELKSIMAVYEKRGQSQG